MKEIKHDLVFKYFEMLQVRKRTAQDGEMPAVNSDKDAFKIFWKEKEPANH